MEREILFRGKRADTQKTVYGCYLKLNSTETLHIIVDDHGEYHRIIPETLGQFTGLTDKNGTRIFEGDILDLTYYLVPRVGIVKFGEYKDVDMPDDYPCGHVGFYVDIIRQSFFRKDILFFAPECKVISNVFDNPELLKGE